MKILLIPPNDLLRHPVPNRMYHIAKRLARNYDIYLLFYTKHLLADGVAEFKVWYKQGVYTCSTHIELENTMKYLLNNLDEVRASLHEYSHSFREAFSWDRLAEKYKDILEAIVQKF